jgi:integrase
MAESEDTSAPKPKWRSKGGRREASLEGTNLYRDTRSGVLIWRRTDPNTKERIKKTTGTTVLEYALKKAQDFEDDFQKRKAGIKTYDSWTRPLLPLVDEWVAYMQQRDKPPTERWLQQNAQTIERALDELKLKTAADLTNVGAVDGRLKLLGKPDSTLRRRYQDPLRMFSAWLAENGRYLEHDPLSTWKVIQYEAQAMHRAFSPDEMARALVAADWLHVIHRRQHSLRIALEVLLMAGPRVEALIERDVEHYLRDERRIDFGDGKGKKLRGQGKLDAKTAAALEASLGDRTEGPLVLTPRGERLQAGNFLKWWKECFSLGVVRELWPSFEDWDLELAHFVNQTLLRESKEPWMPASSVVPSQRKAHRVKVAKVQKLADALRPKWEAGMDRVTVHSFRHTHQTWARAANVDQVLVNLQVGWKASSNGIDLEAARSAASTVGLSHYLDSRSTLLDARRSAEAVRALLDEALARQAPVAKPEADATGARSVG